MADAVVQITADAGISKSQEEYLHPDEVQNMIDMKTREHMAEMEDRNRRCTN